MSAVRPGIEPSGNERAAKAAPAVPPDAPLLRVQALAKAFGGVRALAGVSFELAEGELLALIGPNGAGKSTCFNLINGQLRPDAGSIRLGDTDIAGLRPRAIWRRGVGRTFQVAATFGSMTVAENVQMALLSHADELSRLWPPAATRQRQQALALLDLVGLADRADEPCATLAYGDIKTVELAVALANQPRLLLMDEPTAGMAPAERDALMTLTRRLVKELRVAVLFTEHSMDVVFAHADRILVLARGELIAQGLPAEIRDNARVAQVYFGSGRFSGTAAGPTRAEGRQP